MQAEILVSRPRRALQEPWWPSASALIAGGVALAIALLVPRWFSDPVGVDPYLLRITAVSLVLVVVVWRPAGLRVTRGVFLAMAAVCAPFSAWLFVPRLCDDLWGDRLSFPAELAAAGAVQVVMVAGFAVVSRRLPADQRPSLRTRGHSRAAALAGVGGVAVFLAIAMLLPARWLGREALQPAMLARDGLWLVVAGALQAAGQEIAFRGMLLGALERGCSPLFANLGQAAFFGFAHLAVQYEGPAGPFVPVTIALGLVLGWVTQRTRSLWPAIVIHAVADIAVTVGVVSGLYGY